MHIERSVGLWSKAILSGGTGNINIVFSMSFINMSTWKNIQEQREGRQEDGHRNESILARVYSGKLWFERLPRWLPGTKL